MDIYAKRKSSLLPPELLASLPKDIANEILLNEWCDVNEIRLRRNGSCTVLCESSKSITLKSTINAEQMAQTVKELCGGSLYAFKDTIIKGYISLRCGVRVGLCGRAVYDGGKLIGVYDISSLCIRIPRHVTGVGESICRLITDQRLTEGILIYSPPGVGKTTLLRSVTEKLASPPYSFRTALIDTKGELALDLPKKACCDVLSGYTKGYGIELALHNMNPELIVCDEIGGDVSDLAAIKASLNAGVPLLASTHAADLPSLLRRPSIAELHKSACFAYYVGIKRYGRDFTYSIAKRHEADRYAV